MITLHCPKILTLSYLCYEVVYLCVTHLFTMIMKAENIDINSKKNEETIIIEKKKSGNLKKNIGIV